MAGPSRDQIYRLWKRGTAPPDSPREALIVLGGATVRGQYGGIVHGLAFWLTDPHVLGAVAAAAIAVPVAVHNSQRPSSP